MNIPIVLTQHDITVKPSGEGWVVLTIRHPNDDRPPTEVAILPAAAAVLAVQLAQSFVASEVYGDEGEANAADMCRAMFGVGQVRHNMAPIKFERR